MQAADSYERVREADGEVQFQNDLQTTVSDIKVCFIITYGQS